MPDWDFLFRTAHIFFSNCDSGPSLEVAGLQQLSAVARKVIFVLVPVEFGLEFVLREIHSVSA